MQCILYSVSLPKLPAILDERERRKREREVRDH